MPIYGPCRLDSISQDGAIFEILSFIAKRFSSETGGFMDQFMNQLMKQWQGKQQFLFGSFLESTRILLFVPIIALALSSCSRLQYSPEENNAPVQVKGLEECSGESCEAMNQGNASCTFNGSTVAHNEKITAYKDSSVNQGGVCVSQERQCKNGILTGTFQFAACQPQAPKSCLFNGMTINHGEAIQSFLTSTVPAGESCVSQNRVCVDGTLSGAYQYAACQAGAAASCVLNGVTIPSGSGGIAFLNPTIAPGEFCQAEYRMCKNGSLGGSYTHETCGSPLVQTSCSFNGLTIASGSQVTAYQNSSVAAGQTCQSQIRTCTSGTLSGSYAYANCEVNAPSSCLFNGITIPSGAGVVAFQNSTVPFGDTCTSQLRVCTNGSLSGNYTSSHCNVGAAASCSFNGQTIPHQGFAVAFKKSNVNHPETCESQSRRCINGSLTGTFQFGSCAQNAPQSCQFNGTTIAHGQKVLAYEKSRVGPGLACQSHYRLCHHGTLTGHYQHSSCDAGTAEWVNTVNSSESYSAACARFGAVPFNSMFGLGKGICASTESRPGEGSGEGWNDIHYIHGIVNNHGQVYGQYRGGTSVQSKRGQFYCYKHYSDQSQKHDYDRTDLVVAYLCWK